MLKVQAEIVLCAVHKKEGSKFCLAEWRGHFVILIFFRSYRFFHGALLETQFVCSNLFSLNELNINIMSKTSEKDAS